MTLHPRPIRRSPTARRIAAVTVVVLAALGCRAADRGRSAPQPASSPTPPTVATTLRILPLGDSITQGNRRHLSYRYPLRQHLQAAGIAVDLVGSMGRDPGAPDYPDTSFDRDHEGHWGWRADQLRAELPGWLATYTPDVVLLHAGTNDVFQGEPIATIVADLEDLVAVLRADNPSVAILLARLIPTGDATANSAIVALNAGIDQLAARLPGVTVVDQFTGFDPARHSDDGIHPNAAGEALMADRWLTAIRAVTIPGSRPAPPVADPTP